jgi:hypothetical protein
MPRSATVLDALVCATRRRATARLRGAAAARGATSGWPASATRHSGAMALTGFDATRAAAGRAAAARAPQRALCAAPAGRSRSGGASARITAAP